MVNPNKYRRPPPRRRIKHRRNPRHRKIKRVVDSSVDGVDFISSMPDEILHHILSFIPTMFSIRTSSLSRRWMHLWCETPSLDFIGREYYVREINQTLSSYKAPKITSFRLGLPQRVHEPQIDRWIEFAVSRNVKKLSLVFDGNNRPNYRLPNFFYLSCSLDQLSVDYDMIPGCTVSWKSLRQLTLSNCNLYDESIANILSGSPVLDTLRLIECFGLERLDLSISYSLKRLEIDNNDRDQGPTEIVAPQIHYLNFSLCFCRRAYYDASCILVDVSSLSEARLEIHMNTYLPLRGYCLQTVVKMLAELQNVKRLNLTRLVLQIISLSELCGVPFPTLKVQTLTIKTRFERSVIPGIAGLLQNSSELKKLITQATDSVGIQDKYLDRYLDSQVLNLDQCWRSKYKFFPTSIEFCSVLYCKDATLKLMASFMEMVMTNGKTLETLVVGLGYIDDFVKGIWFEELLQMTQTLSNNNNVSIVLKC